MKINEANGTELKAHWKLYTKEEGVNLKKKKRKERTVLMLSSGFRCYVYWCSLK